VSEGKMKTYYNKQRRHTRISKLGKRVAAGSWQVSMYRNSIKNSKGGEK